MRKEPQAGISRPVSPWGRTATFVFCGTALLSVLPRPICAQDGLPDVLAGVSVGPWHAAESPDALATAEQVTAARMQLALGNARRAIELLTDSTLAAPVTAEAGVVLAEAYFAAGEFAAAAEHFARAAEGSVREDQPVLLARAGDAAERAGLRTSAALHYGHAADLSSPASAWLRMRTARVSDDLAAVRIMLADAPPAGRKLAMTIEADASLYAGDTTRAIQLYASLGLYARSAELSLAAGHRSLARELVYAALDRPEEPQARDAAPLALERFGPSNRIEVEQLARVLTRYGRAHDAATMVGEWAAGDSSESVLELLGEMKEAAGDRWGALAAYEQSARGETTVAGEAEYRRIRLMVRMGRTTSAVAALKSYAVKFPRHARVAWATYLLGDLWWDASLRAASDSVFAALVERWPESDYADRARYRLAARALLRADTASAIQRFKVAADGGGDQARFARFQLAVLLRAAGRGEEARDALVQLAREDSVGYYGMIARDEAGLPLPDYPVPEAATASEPVVEVLATLDFLDRAGFAQEAEALVDYAIDHAGLDQDQRLELAEGLIERNRTVRAIRLGWQLTRDFSLNHPRVIRVIFPYPNRELVETEAAKFGLDPFLVAGMIRQESAFDVDAVSRAGARGLMQLMPATARGLARRQGLNWTNTFLSVPDANVHVGTAHLSALMRQYGGRVERALAAYNAGGRPVERWLRYPEAGDRHRWIERIPYVETQGYLKTVLRNRDLYRALYGDRPIP